MNNPRTDAPAANDLASHEAQANLPVVKELLPAPDVAACLRRWSSLDHCIFLDSAAKSENLGRYSFMAAEPYDWLRVELDHSDPFEELRTRLNKLRATIISELPPFQGGAAGVFSYDLNRNLEKVPLTACDEFSFPAMAIGFYDVVVAWDHFQDRAWIISQGWPETESNSRRRRANERVAWAESIIQSSAKTRRDSIRSKPVQLAPQFPVEGYAGLTSNFSKADYLSAVQKAIDYIHAGDLFQVNLSQRLLTPFDSDPVDAYLRLRSANPAPFAAYFDLGSHQLLSASPERYVQMRDRLVETRPIKGTRRRTSFPEADLHSANDLLTSEKERAENVMIVDLLRNDLSRVCNPDSVKVTQLCELELFQYVQHLVSVVQAELKSEHDTVDLIKAMFPGGSITGAPKVRAMQVIAELEPTARGAYCGCMGYIGAGGTTDLNISIRTITASNGYCQIPVGGGIVADSDPIREYAETWEKATGLLGNLQVNGTFHKSGAIP